MNLGGQDEKFWLAVIRAAIFKVWTSKTSHRSIWAAAATGAFAIFCPYVFTDSALTVLGWGENYKILVAAMLTLTGEGIMRWVVNLTPEKALEFWKEFKK